MHLEADVSCKKPLRIRILELTVSLRVLNIHLVQKNIFCSFENNSFYHTIGNYDTKGV